MNPSQDNTKALGGGAESQEERVLSENSTHYPDDMKRAAAQLIERYFFQLVEGCGNPSCANNDCASSGHSARPLSRNEAAAKALELFKSKAALCERAPCKVVKRGEDEADSGAGVSGTATVAASASRGSTAVRQAVVQASDDLDTDSGDVEPSVTKKTKPDPPAPKATHLTEQMVLDLIDQCKKDENFSPLVRMIGEVFSDWRLLNKSFLLEKVPDEPPPDKQLSQKEWNRAQQEEEKEADESSSNPGSSNAQTSTKRTEYVNLTVDIPSVQRTFAALYAVSEQRVMNALLTAVISLSQMVEIDVRWVPMFATDADHLNCIIVMMENNMLQSPEYLDVAFPSFCRALGHLPLPAQARLAKIWSRFPAANLLKKLECLQQLITFKVLSDHGGIIPTRTYINDDDSICSATKVMRIIYYASVVGGVLSRPTSSIAAEEEIDFQEVLGAIAHENKENKKIPPEDPLASQLKVSVLDSRKPLIAFSEFYNEPLNDQIAMEQDFTCYKKESEGRFSFLNFPFILTPASKNLGLYYDNRIRMHNERRLTLLSSIVQGDQYNPYLKLKVRRDHVVDDALVRLEMVAMDNPSDLKKQLYVEFEGEQGVDEGGVSKEFFQLVIEEIFNPDIGMFTYNEDTSAYWFNPTSFEVERQYTLIGIVLGLAIYNNIILDIQFPMVVYRKLMGRRGTVEDLQESQPVIYNSMKSILEYEGDVEEMVMMYFVISYTDVFGNTISHSLKEDGENVQVNNDNRQEFVDLYADFLLNKSVERQFRSFKKGFDMVTDESPLKIWFRPEEIELLVCGSKDFDFEALEDAAEYDGGYTRHCDIIRFFWEIVHDMDEDQKKKLLMFTTGSDRVPVGGLSKLKLIIAKNGADSDRLPTSHTCFNVLLLPEYCSKDKLQERLLKAITHAKGFGML
ncbi:ubiquitin-protein ligase E3A-like [Amphiura filiformis]|uniref:ubiquitin-protein ligase E3A-like n=1 Tax=Amphiura filiformis TaxID=82378 RepID=UPI003B22621A